MRPALANQAYKLTSEYVDVLANNLKLSRRQALQLIRDTCKLFANTNSGAERVRWDELAASYDRVLSVGLKKWLEDMPDEEGMFFLQRVGKTTGILRRELGKWTKRLTLSGGNPRKLTLAEIAEARTRFAELIKSGTSKEKGYENVAKEIRRKKKYRVSAHTIRRACDPEEARRSGCTYPGGDAPIGFIQVVEPRK